MNRHPRQLGCTSTAVRGACRGGSHGAVPWLVVVAVFVAPATGLRPARAEDAVTDSAGMREFLARHCAECHGDSKPEGDVTLSWPADEADLLAQRNIWETAVRRVEAGEMPPQDQPRPDAAEAASFVAGMRQRYADADLRAPADPGRVTMRRLNRLEYRNTIRDLVGVDFDPTNDFPSDEIGYGFDTIGDVLTISPLLMERYLDAAEAVMERAIPTTPPPVVKRRRQAKYTEPASPDVKRLIVAGFRRMSTDGKGPIELGPINAPFEWEADGEYELRTKVYAAADTPQPVRLTLLVSGKELPQPAAQEDLDRLSGSVPRAARILGSFVVTGTSKETANEFTVRVPPLPGRDRVLIAIEKPATDAIDAPEATDNTEATNGEQTTDIPATTAFVEGLELSGPLDSRPATQKLLLACVATESQEDQTREVLGRFLRRAFRRRVEPGELDRHVALVDKAVKSGRDWHAGVQFAMQAALCSPKFLFHVESDDSPDAEGVQSLDEFQLASRLSFFLWSTMPDDELLDLADRGQLSENLDAQVRRMLADPRAGALVTSFAMQWLQLKRIEFISPDGELFPTFNNVLRTAMLQETELFVGGVFHEDRSVLELIDADSTFVNAPLAKHYGLEDAYRKAGGTGKDFRRVPTADRTRGGLLAQAGILTATSNPTRTSPVKRGRWVLEQLLGEPPPPPPPNVPELEENEGASTTASLRERMEVHRSNAACAGCHARMDAIGFALENYDAVGAFRTKDGAFDIDADGTFPNGISFSGPAGLKDVLMAKKREFCRCLTEKMMTFALGRGLEPADRSTIERIVDRLESQDHKVSALVAGIVTSDAFRQRRGGGTGE
jgi:mono/diheme cytochrome c family protein